MSTKVHLQAEGLEELTNQLLNLTPRSANNVMRNAVTDLARDVRDEMKARAPEDTGTLKKAIKAIRRRGKKDLLESHVFITHGKGQRYDAFYWHFVEFGTASYAPGDKRKSSSGGRVFERTIKKHIPANPAKPFITPAAEAIRPRVPRLMREHFGKRFEKEVARLVKKQGKVR